MRAGRYVVSSLIVTGVAVGSAAAAKIPDLSLPLPTPLAGVPQGAAVVNVNKDTIPDLLVVATAKAKPPTRALATYIGLGDGTFRPGTSVTFPSQFATRVVTADIDGDGDMDAIVPSVLASNGNNVLQTFMNNGKGVFARGPVIDTETTDDLTTGLIDGDTRPDLVRVQTIPQSGVFVDLGAAGGRFPVTVAVRTGTGASKVAVGDVNGDGKADIVTADKSAGASTGVSVFIGNGDSTFKPATTTAFPAPVYGASFGEVVALTVSDVDGDKKPDIIVGRGFEGTLVAPGNGDGTFGPFRNIAGPGSGSLSVGDVNGDGIVDIAVADTNLAKRVAVLLGNPGGAYQSVSFAAGRTPADVFVGDLNRDGKSDVLTFNPSSKNVTSLMNTITRPVLAGFGGPATIRVGRTAKIAFTLSRPSKVAFQFKRGSRIVGRATLNGAAGPNTVVLVATRRLARGTFTVTARATAAGGSLTKSITILVR